MGKKLGDAIEMDFVRTRTRITLVSPSKSIIDIRVGRDVHLYEISANIASFLDLSKKPNWRADALHDYETCHCDRGKIGTAKLAAANEKRRAFYKTEAGIATKAKYREKAAVKRRIINELQIFTVSNKAQLSKERIQTLVKLL